MKSPKPIVAGALVAGSLLLGGGIAAAVALPDQASDTAEEHTTDVETSKPEDPQATAEEHRQDGDRPEATTEDDAEEATEAADEAAEEAGEESAETGERPTDTHGYVVSTFAHETELEGREKGEAISTLARSDEGKPAAAGKAGKAPGKP